MLTSLGIIDIRQANELRQRCHLHRAMVDREDVDGKVHCTIQNQEELQNLLKLDFSVKQISELYGVSEKTVRRRITAFGLTGSKYTEITDEDLATVMSDIISMHEGIGEKMMDVFLRARNIRVKRQRVRDFMHHLDPAGVDERSRYGLHRRQYSVPHANALWHIDGNHKLIRLITFVIVTYYIKARSCV